MSFRKFSALLLLLSACATTEPKRQSQVAIPWVPLLEPKPIVLPAPVGLTPPMTVMVDPHAPMQQEPEVNPEPVPENSGAPRGPTAPLTPQRGPECTPVMTRHLGGDELHNRCADNVPQNDFRGFDALVNGKRFDALQLGRSVLWEIKTDNFDAYSPDLQRIVIGKQVAELKRERDIARACGFDFYVGVRSAAHMSALLNEERNLNVIVMSWC